MMKMLKGSIIKNGKYYEFHIFIHGNNNIIAELSNVIEKKLHQKGWIPH